MLSTEQVLHDVHGALERVTWSIDRLHRHYVGTALHQEAQHAQAVAALLLAFGRGPLGEPAQAVLREPHACGQVRRRCTEFDMGVAAERLGKSAGGGGGHGSV